VEIYGSRYSEIGAELSTLPKLREMLLHVTFPEDIDESRMDVVTSVAQFLRTCPPGHQLKEMHLGFEIVLDLTNVDEAPQAMERVLKSGNWAALDSVLVSMTNSVTHFFQVEVHVSFWLSLEFTTPPDPFGRKEVMAENNEYLGDWGQKYLPRISATESPNLNLKISTQVS
jgi:hypothetical protein